MDTQRHTESQVARLVRENQKLVEYMVNRTMSRCHVGTMEREDLVSWGNLGLLQAARAWDPARGAFSTLACKAIERMLIRGVQREWHPGEAARTVSLDEPVDGDSAGRVIRFGDTLVDVDRDVEREALLGLDTRAVRRAVAALPAEERRLLVRRYWHEERASELAAEAGMTRQGIYQREWKALRSLRDQLAPALAA